MSLRGIVTNEATLYLIDIIEIATFTVVPPHALLGASTHRNDKRVLLHSTIAEVTIA